MTVLIISLSLISCTNKQTKSENLIVGKWEFAKFEPNVITSDSAATAQIENEMLGAKDRMGIDPEGNIMTMSFSKNGIFTSPDNTPGTYSVDNGKLSLRIQGNVMINDYEIRNDTLIIDFDLKKIYGNDLKKNFNLEDEVEVEKLEMIQYHKRK